MPQTSINAAASGNNTILDVRATDRIGINGYVLVAAGAVTAIIKDSTGVEFGRYAFNANSLTASVPTGKGSRFFAHGDLIMNLSGAVGVTGNLDYAANQSDTVSSLLDGLQAFYRFDSGVTDSSGNAKTLTAAGTPTYTTGKIGSALITSDTVFATRAAVVTSLPCSFAGWFQMTTGGGGNAQVTLLAEASAANITAGTGNVGLLLKTDTGTVVLCTSSGVVQSVIAADTWFHAAATYEAGANRLYINGAQVGANSTTASFTGVDTLGIGTHSASGNIYADLCGVWNRTITAAEVAALYAAGSAFDPTA